MKTETLAAFVAIAATTVSATWHGAQPFKCPTKVPEICIPKQHGGYDFGDLIPGKFEHHNGFDFRGGWECKESFGGRKRDALLPRTFKPKCITAEVKDKKEDCPKISAGSNGPKKFAITKFQVSVEFDCELEFHYTMPDKSTCKHKSHCKKSGTEIENKQCGGATDVVIVMPKPPKEVKKKTCKIGLHKIDFNCPKPGDTKPPGEVEPPKTPKPVKTPIDTKTPTDTKPVETAPPAESSPATPPTSSVTSNSPVETSPAPVTPGTCSEEISKVPTCAANCIRLAGEAISCEKDDFACLCKSKGDLPELIGGCLVNACPDLSSVVAATDKVCDCLASPPKDTSPAETKPVETSPAETKPVETSPAETKPVETSPAETKPVETSPAETKPIETSPAETKPIESVPVGTNPAQSPPVETKPIESAPYSNATITTSNSPAQTTPAPEQPTIILTTVVVEETVTTCPVTSTHVEGGVTSIETSLTVSTISITRTATITSCAGGCTKGPKPTEAPATEKPEESVTSNSPQPTSPSTPEEETPETPSGPSGPAPPLLPSCLNTWLPEECDSNSDVDCFCPKADFTKDVFECLAAHGASQEEIDSAVDYFQGLCAPFVPVNPGIITDCPERPEEAPQQTKPAGPVTTIIVDTIITVPCTPEVGTITTSSSVSTVKTQVTVPQVILTTVTGGDVGVVPGTHTAPPAVIASTTANAGTQPTKPAEQPAYPTAAPETPSGEVPTEGETPSEETPSEETPVEEQPSCEGAECPGQEVPAPVPTTLAPVPVPVGTGGSTGTVTRAPAPTAPLFTGAASAQRVGGGMIAAALGFAMMI